MDVSWKVDRSLKSVLLTKSAKQTAASRARVERLATASHFPWEKKSSLYQAWKVLQNPALTFPSSPIFLSTPLLLAVLQQIHLPVVLPTFQAFSLLRASPHALSSAWNPVCPHTSHPLSSTWLTAISSSFCFSVTSFREVFPDFLIYRTLASYTMSGALYLSPVWPRSYHLPQHKWLPEAQRGRVGCPNYQHILAKGISARIPARERQYTWICLI